MAELGSLKPWSWVRFPPGPPNKGVIMNEDLKQMAEDVFNATSFVLTEKGEIPPIYFIIKDGMMNPIVGSPGMTYNKLAATAVNIAHEWGAEAIIMIYEQTGLKIYKDNPEYQDYLDGIKRPSEASNSEDYLTLIYMSKEGQAESLVAKIEKTMNGIRYIKEDPTWMDKTVTNMITPWQ